MRRLSEVDGTLSAGELAVELDLEVTVVRYHLRVLMRYGLVGKPDAPGFLCRDHGPPQPRAEWPCTQEVVGLISCARSASRSFTPASREDAEAERTILAFLLEEHPAQIAITELSRSLSVYSDDFDEDAIQSAVRELVGAGLLHHEGAFVLPTRAARYFAALSLD